MTPITTQTLDALGRTITLNHPPQRIVSLVPSLTEWLFAVGAGPRVVGITDYCLEPATALAGLPRLRGTKNPDRAAILALQPDLVLVDQEENRERDVQALTAAGLTVYATAIRSVADVPVQLSNLAALLGVSSAAAPGLAAIQATIHEREPAHSPRLNMLCFIWRDPWMAIGATTYADDLLRLAGFNNLAHALPGRYPRASLEQFMALQPDLILLPSEPYPFSSADFDAFTPFGAVPAVHQQRLYLCDGMALTWPGPRTVAAIKTFEALIPPW